MVKKPGIISSTIEIEEDLFLYIKHLRDLEICIGSNHLRDLEICIGSNEIIIKTYH